MLLHTLDQAQAIPLLWAPQMGLNSPIAQSVEQMTVNHWVAGSSPARGANEFKDSGNFLLRENSAGAMIALGLKFIIQVTFTSNARREFSSVS
jgi:hypothetical protein